MRVFLLVFFAACTAYVGFMWTAQLQLEARLNAVRQESKSACMGRGTTLPTAETMQERIEGLGPTHRVELSDVQVVVRELNAATDTAGGAQVEAGFGGALHMSGTVAEISAHMHAKRWLWDTDAELSSRCVLERKLERVLPPTPQN